MPALKIAISGISGRMGQILVQAALEDRSVQLAGALARAGSEWTGRDAGARFGQTTGVAVSEDIEAGLAKVEYLIDFTSAEYTLACLPVARRHGIKLVIGTTGFSEQQRAGIEIASRALPIVLAPNMSMGVNLYLKLIETAARLLRIGTILKLLRRITGTKPMRPLAPRSKWVKSSRAQQGAIYPKCPSADALRSPVRANHWKSVFQRFAAAILWAITPFCLPERASASS